MKISKKIVSSVATAALVTGALVAGTATAAAATCTGKLKLVYQGGLTGPVAQVGINESRGMILAIEKYNKTAKTKVEYGRIDTQGNKKYSPALAAGIVTDPCVVGVVGGMYSGETIAAVPYYDEAGLPVISPSATNPGLSNISPVFHRVVASDLVQGPAITKIALGIKGAKLFVVDDQTDYGKGLADIVKKGAAKILVGKDAVTEGTTNFSSVVTKVKNAKANVVFYGGYFPEAAIFVKALRDNPATSKVTFIGGDGVLDDEYVRLAKKNAEGTILTAPFIPMGQADPKLAAEYKKRWKDEPGVYTLETYNSANFFLDAIAKGNKTRATILAYIDTFRFKGVGMELFFNEKGDVDSTLINQFVIKNGKVVYVKAVIK